jgi:hypothetical protein
MSTRQLVRNRSILRTAMESDFAATYGACLQSLLSRDQLYSLDHRSHRRFCRSRHRGFGSPALPASTAGSRKELNLAGIWP